MIMLTVQDLRMSSTNRLSNLGRVMCRHVQYTTIGSHRDDSDRRSSTRQLLSCAMNRLRHTYGRHIYQNVLAKLTEMVKDEGVSTQFVNGTCNKLINKIDEVECHRKLDGLKTKWQQRPDFIHYLFNTWLNPLAHKFCRHLFLNIDSLIEGQIAKINKPLEISKLKEKYGAKSNLILKNIGNITSHLALKKIWLEIKRAHKIVDDPKNKCGLKIGVDIPTVHERDVDSKMRDLTSMLEKISTGPVLKVREMRRLIKGVIGPVLPDNPYVPLITPSPINCSHEGTTEEEFNKRDKPYWEHASVAQGRSKS
ncbi:hypothetical protein M9H77_28160 [Catharanthus roseus]|uniref:Uncharacterized protein n=1 Tax=Catharanthus roseus TaxID=4058 RepID=A0ACC0AEI6_CATRO|nr:hypothetical protein M9H77_28160 [Catharanthus roseus]